MSSFMVSDETMNRVCHAMDKNNLPCEALDDLGRRLFAMNFRAVCARYKPEQVEQMKWDDGQTFVYSFRLGYTQFDLLKALDCLIYQCSEGNVPSESLYAELTATRDALRARIVCELPEYHGAKWDADEHPIGWPQYDKPAAIFALTDALRSFSSAVWSDCRLPGDLRNELASLYHTEVRPLIAEATATAPLGWESIDTSTEVLEVAYDRETGRATFSPRQISEGGAE